MKIYTGMGQARVSNYSKRPLQEVLGCAPDIILTIFFCRVKIFAMFGELHQTFVHT